MDGIIRKIDDLGRIVLPKELRQIHDMQEKDPISITSTADGILLTKYTPVCTFCGNTENLKYHEDKAICQSCIEALK